MCGSNYAETAASARRLCLERTGNNTARHENPNGASAGPSPMNDSITQIQLPAFNFQLSAFNIQPSTCNFRPATSHHQAYLSKMRRVFHMPQCIRCLIKPEHSIDEWPQFVQRDRAVHIFKHCPRAHENPLDPHI